MTRHDEMLSRFSLIDSNRVVRAPGSVPLESYRSDKLGYRIDLSNSSWSKAPLKASPMRQADFCALQDSGSVFMAAPVQLPEGEFSMEELTCACMYTLDADFTPELKAEEQPAEEGEAKGIEFVYTNEALASTGLEMHCQILRRGRMAYFLAAWAPARNAKSLASVLGSNDAIEFFDPVDASNDHGSESQREWRGNVLNELGVLAQHRHEGDQAVRCFAEAIHLIPRNATVLDNLVSALSIVGRTDEAIAELEKRLPKFPHEEQLHATYAVLLSVSGKTARACEEFERLFSKGYSNTDDLLKLVTLYLESDDDKSALAACDEFLMTRPSSKVESWRGQLLSKVGEHDKAIAALEEVCAAKPGDQQAVYDLVAAYRAAEKCTEAMAVSERLLESGTNSDEVHVVRGLCQLDMKCHQEAKESFQLALAVNPVNAEAKEGLAVASALLGQGDNAAVKTPIEPVVIPPEIAERLNSLPAAEYSAADFGACELYRLTGYSFVPDEHWKRTQFRKVKILSPEGVTRYRSLTIEFNPLTERVFVNRVTVHNETGQLVGEGKVEDYFVVDSQDDMAAGKSVVNVPVPSLQPGCVLEYVTTVESTAVGMDFGFEQVVLSSGVPVQAAGVFVSGSVDRIGAVSTGPPERAAANGTRFWGASELPAYEWEDHQAPRETFLPIVALGDAGKTWADVGRTYLARIQERLQDEPAVRKLAAELTRQIADDEKIAVLARYVQKETTYQAIEFGVRGLIPNAAAKTLELRYGDCKDHAVLLKQLLNAAGVPAELALVRTEGPVAAELPSLDQFDHMIVAIAPQGAESQPLLLDCTAKYSDPTWQTPAYHQGEQVLLLDPVQPRLVTVPPPPESSYQMQCRREVEIIVSSSNAETADALVREDVTFSAGASSAIRSVLADREPRDRVAAIEDILPAKERIRVLKADIKDLDNPSRPLGLHIEYRMDRAFHRTGGVNGSFIGKAPVPWESWWAEVEHAARRSTPFKLLPAKLDAWVRLVVPAGYAVSRAAASVDSATSNRFLNWSCVAKSPSDTSILVLRRANESPAADYATYYDESQRLLEVLEKPIQLDPLKP